MREYTEQRRQQLEDHLLFLRKTHNQHIGVEVRRFLEGVCKEIIRENGGIVPQKSSLSSLIEVLHQLSKSGRSDIISVHFVNSLRAIMHPLNQSAHHTITFRPNAMSVENMLTSERDVLLQLYGYDLKIEDIFNKTILELKKRKNGEPVNRDKVNFLILAFIALVSFSIAWSFMRDSPFDAERAIKVDDKSGVYYSDGKVTIQSLRKRPPEHIKEALRAYTRYRVSYLYRRIDDVKRELMPELKCFYNKKDYSADAFIKRRFSNKEYKPNTEKPRVIILKTDPQYWSDDWVYISAVEEDDVPFMKGQVVVFQRLNGEWKLAAEFFPNDPKQSRCAPNIENGRLIW